MFGAGLLLTSGIAAAGAESGFYLGGSVGSSSMDVSTENVSFNGDDTAYKAFVGYNFGWIPLVDFAVEGSYLDFGSVSSPQISNNDVSITGWDLLGLVGFKLGPVGLFGKAGVIEWSSNSDALQSGLDASGNDPAYGIGLKFTLWSIGVRAEYELFQTDATDIGLASVGATWTF